MNIEEVRALFPGRDIPSEEEIAQKIDEHNARVAADAQARAEKESRLQSIRDRLNNIRDEESSLQAELAELDIEVQG